MEVESGGMLVSRAPRAAFQGAGSLGAERKPWAAESLRPESEYTNEQNLFLVCLCGFVLTLNQFYRSYNPRI